MRTCSTTLPAFWGLVFAFHCEVSCEYQTWTRKEPCTLANRFERQPHVLSLQLAVRSCGLNSAHKHCSIGTHALRQLITSACFRPFFTFLVPLVFGRCYTSVRRRRLAHTNAPHTFPSVTDTASNSSCALAVGGAGIQRLRGCPCRHPRARRSREIRPRRRGGWVLRYNAGECWRGK